MRNTVILVCFSYFPISALAQDPATIISHLQSIDSSLASKPCHTGDAPVISNRAMNLFLADRIGYYLSQYHDVSFHKNYISFNSLDGVFSLNHNFYQARGVDERVKAFTVGGLKANIANALESAFEGKKLPNEIGLTAGRTWFARVKTHTNRCEAVPPADPQKQNMDALRAGILHHLKAELTSNQAEFERELDSISSADVPGQDIDRAKSLLRQKFYQDMLNSYSWEFARRQSDDLITTGNYNLISTSWTRIYGYVPILPPAYSFSDSATNQLRTEYGFPFDVEISHTRFLESRKSGRFFLILSAGAYLNNDVNSHPTGKVRSYENFLTPVIKGQIVYFPPRSHVGINLDFEQNFGEYNALSGVVGIPIVLIDRSGHPAANFQFQCRFFDITGKTLPNETIFDKTSIGLNLAVPFSKIIY